MLINCRATMKPIIFCLLAAAATMAIGAKAAVIFQDDFETPSPQSPPPGWAMWGAPQFKVPAHYTLDSAQPHQGRQCFRIDHPGNTGGYVVSGPERAIHPQPATIYTVSFWARSNKPGRAMFQWTAYRTINPFTDAPSPGSFPFHAGPEWKEFVFSVREGLDFFAEQGRFLLLTFMASADQKEARTLWIDDARVSEEPDPNPAVLINEATLPHEPIPHRLRPGDQLEFTVDPLRRLGRVASEVGGVSFHRVCGWTGQPYNKRGDYTLGPELEKAIREMQLPMTRFYAVGDEPFGLESAIDKVAEICRQVGVTQDHCVLEFEEQGASTQLPAESWVRGVRHSLDRGFQFHQWEIANEPYSSLWGRGQAFPNSEAFIAHFQSVSHAIREADPKAQIGVDINTEQVRWGNYVLKELAGSYDFVAPHYYCGADVHKLPFEEVVLTENYRMLDRILRVGALIRAYNPNRDVSQYDTEWGMICSTPEGKDADYEDRNANIVGTMHRAVRLIYYAREGLLRGASGWQMFSRLDAQGFGILSQEAPNQRFMLYWLYYYFNRHLGEWALLTDGTAPYYRPEPSNRQFGGPISPTLASLSKDGRHIYLVLANGSWSRAVPGRVHVRGFGSFRAMGIVLGNGDLDGKPLLKHKEDAVADSAVTVTGDAVNCTLPPHSVVFVTLTKD
jgi:alpha-L-arabinofuranosidase